MKTARTRPNPENLIAVIAFLASNRFTLLSLAGLAAGTIAYYQLEMPGPLWFIAVYVSITALAPLTYRW